MASEELTPSKAIALYCDSLKLGDEPFSSDYYWQAYQDLMLALVERGVNVYMVSGNDTYQGDGNFAVAYLITKKTELTDLDKKENVHVDMVFNRGGFTGTGVLVINSPFMQKIGMNKIEMYKNFPSFQPFSVICDSKEDLANALQQIESNKVVVKEPEGFGGKQVYISEKTDILNRIPDNYPLLLQEFLDTSIGVPGYVDGIHDVRLSMCGGKLIGCYVRQAAPGELHSNVSLGGKMIFLDIDNAPKEAVEAAYKIDELFKEYPRYYSVDFVNTPKGWKMLELNPLLALLPVTDGPEATKTMHLLADYLAECVKS